MPDQAVTIAVGLFGKLPAHGDFVRRGVPASLTGAIDDWLQTELGRASDPDATIAAIAPLRFASTALAPGQLVLGTLIASGDRVGRAYPLVAVRVSPNPSEALPEPLPPAWDDWCGRAEAIIIAARANRWLADATQAALETAARATVMALVAAPMFAVPADRAPATMTWRPALEPGPRDVARVFGLPQGEAFDRLVGQAAG